MKEFLLLLFLLTAPLVAPQWPMPSLMLPSSLSCSPGDTMEMPVKVWNTSTVVLWDSKVFIDTKRMTSEDASHVTVIKGEVELGRKVEPEAVIESALSISIVPNTPPSTIKIPITLAGRYGKCQSGCKPYLTKGEIALTIKSVKPILYILSEKNRYEVQADNTFSLDVTVENVGEAEAREVLFSVEADKPLSVSYKNISSKIEAGMKEASSVNISLPKDTPPMMYSLRLSVSWKDAFGNPYDWRRELGIDVKKAESISKEKMTPAPEIEEQSEEKDSTVDKHFMFYSGFGAGLFSFIATFLFASLWKKR